MNRRCSDCPNAIFPRNKSGRCKSCCARNTITTVKPWLQTLAVRQTPEYRERIGRSVVESRLGWCPEYLRPLYRETKKSRLTAPERRAIVLAQYQRDMARVVIA